MNTPNGWEFSAAEHHPRTADGSCMAGPTDAYYRVWATRKSDGRCTMGCGETAEAALETAVRNAEKEDAAEWEATRLFCEAMGYEVTPMQAVKVREHIALHHALSKVGRFYPH